MSVLSYLKYIDYSNQIFEIESLTEATNYNLTEIKGTCHQLTTKETQYLTLKRQPEKALIRTLLFKLDEKVQKLESNSFNYSLEKDKKTKIVALVNQKIILTDEIYFHPNADLENKSLQHIFKSDSICDKIDQNANEIINSNNIIKNKTTNRLIIKKNIFKNLFYALLLISILLLFVVFFILKQYVRNNKKVILNLDQNTKLLQGIIDNSPTPISVKGLDGKYTFTNLKFLESTEKETKNAIGKTDGELFSNGVAEKKREKDLDVIRYKSVIKFEENIKIKGVNTSYIITKFPIANEEGSLTAIGTISTDISDKSKSDLDLFNREKTLKIYFDKCPGALVVIDSKSNIVAVNERTTTLFGWESHEMINQYMPGIMMNQENWDKHDKGMRNFQLTGKGPVLEGSLELIAYNKKKIPFEIELSVKDIKINNEQFFIGLIHDITKKNKLIKSQEENLNFLDSVIENLPNMVFIKDAKQLKFVRINKAGEKLLNLPRNEILGKSDYDFFPKKEADFFTENDRNVLEKKITLDIPEEMISTKSGIRWLHTRKISLYNDSNIPHYLLGISEDITDKKNLEKERDEALKQLKESEFRLELVLSNIGEGVIMTNENQDLLIYNQTATEILNTEDSKILARWTFNFQFFYPDRNEIYPAQMLPLERALRGQTTDDIELLLQEIKTGSFKLIKVNGRPIQDENAKIVAAVATIKDITHLKEIEKKLEESETKYRQIIGFRRDLSEKKVEKEIK
ncbi:MAG: PAS domain-containing protein [Bacteroidota bacterium]